MAHVTRREDGFEVSDETARIDVDLVHQFLSTQTYWATGRARELTDRSIAGSLNFGAYDPTGEQVGFGRLVTDRATVAHLTDVFILPARRGLGLSKFLVETILTHPELTTVRRWTLSTQDAHGLYTRFGFGPMAEPERQMMRLPPKS